VDLHDAYESAGQQVVSQAMGQGMKLGTRPGRGLTLAGVAIAGLLVAGCGNQYRPVVSAVNPVGPAGQPTKYAVAVSNPTSVQDAVTGYAITGNVITVMLDTGSPFSAGQVVTLSGFPVSTFLNGQTLTVLAAGLSTTQFEAALTHANASSTNEGGLASLVGQGLLTFVDVSGDTVLSTPSILSNPSYFQVNSNGSEGFVINQQGSFEDFSLGNPTGLLTTEITPTTLTAGASPQSVTVFSLATQGTTIFIPEAGLQQIAELGASGSSLLQSIAVGPNPVYVVGADGTQRVYAISQGVGGGNGQVAAIESSTASVSSTIPVGKMPVYGVMTADDNRAFILNKGSGTVTVINVPSNALDAAVPTITMPNISAGGASYAPNPVWADFSAVNSEMVVLNQGDGIHAGSLSIINIPLCNSGTPVTNPNCNATNPVDAAGFGTIVATVNVGINPQMVSVLNDGTRAYVANAGDAAAGVEGSVSVVNLLSGTLETTIPAVSNTGEVNSTPTAVFGHPNTISATTGTPTGKVYITSPDSTFLSILRTDEDIVQTHVSLQGTGVRVLVTTK
jgi:hypothetical protein